MQFVIWMLALLITTGHCGALNSCVCDQGSDEGLVILKSHGQRIVNGTEVRPHKYPWMAVMIKGWKHDCGGSIISDRNILTAGHCLYYARKPLESKWIVGSHSVELSRQIGNQIYPIENYRLHPKFHAGDRFDNYDFAIVILEGKITFGPNVKPICLPNVGDDALFWNKRVTVAGWGRVSEYGPPTDVLMESHLLLKSQQECVRLTSGIDYDPKSMICAHEIYTDACQGDSGGPMFAAKANNYHILLGVVSFGDGCARNFPGIYARVSEESTLKWINDMIDKSQGYTCMNPVTSQGKTFPISRTMGFY